MIRTAHLAVATLVEVVTANVVNAQACPTNKCSSNPQAKSRALAVVARSTIRSDCNHGPSIGFALRSVSTPEQTNSYRMKRRK